MHRTTEKQEALLRSAVRTPAPVLPNLPPAGAFVPLVLLAATILPAFYAWAHSSFSEQLVDWVGDAVGLLSNVTVETEQSGRLPPLYTLSAAAALSIPINDKTLLLVLPGYLFALLSLVLVFIIARTWFTMGTGLLTCYLVAVNQAFLQEVQRGEPSVCVLAMALLTIWTVAHYVQSRDLHSWWLYASCISFTGLVLAGGFFALWLAGLGLLTVVYEKLHEQQRLWAAVKGAVLSPPLRLGALFVLGGFALAGLLLYGRGLASGAYSPWRTPETVAEASNIGFLALIEAFPATLVLALYGIARYYRECLRGGPERSYHAFLVLWTFIGLLALGTTRENRAALLFCVAPLTLFAARTLIAILQRSIADRTILSLILASGVVSVLCSSAALRDVLTNVYAAFSAQGVGALFDRQRFVSYEQLFRLHLVIDGVVIVSAVVVLLFRLTARRDGYRRMLIGGYLVVVLLAAFLPTLYREQPADPEAESWHDAYRQVSELPPAPLMVFVSPGPIDSRLTFIGAMAFPQTPARQIDTLADLDQVVSDAGQLPVVFIPAPNPKLPTSTPVTRNGETATLGKVIATDTLAVFAPSTAKQE